MKKNRNVALDSEQLERVIAMAQEEKKPFEVIKAEFGINEKEVTEIMHKRLSKDNFELWKKKVTASKPKPKPINDDFDDLEDKYYMKNKFD
jgi:uncharacterized protein (TIGR03643 family)